MQQVPCQIRYTGNNRDVHYHARRSRVPDAAPAGRSESFSLPLQPTNWPCATIGGALEA